MTDDADREYFIGLMKKFNAVAVKLPREADIIDQNTRAASIAKARSLLAEMQRTKSEIDRMLGIDRPLYRSELKDRDR